MYDHLAGFLGGRTMLKKTPKLYVFWSWPKALDIESENSDYKVQIIIWVTAQ